MAEVIFKPPLPIVEPGAPTDWPACRQGYVLRKREWAEYGGCEKECDGCPIERREKSGAISV